jgi:hypothetical protein
MPSNFCAEEFVASVRHRRANNTAALNDIKLATFQNGQQVQRLYEAIMRNADDWQSIAKATE